MLEKQPFKKYNLTEEADYSKNFVIATKWNTEEIELLKDAGIRLRQPKKGTIIKMLVKIGYAKVVSEQKMVDFVMDSYRRNKRLGIPEIRAEIERNFCKSNQI